MVCVPIRDNDIKSSYKLLKQVLTLFPLTLSIATITSWIKAFRNFLDIGHEHILYYVIISRFYERPPNYESRLLASSFLFVCTLGWIFIKFGVLRFLENLSIKYKFLYNLT
jgi:hypothetical protein